MPEKVPIYRLLHSMLECGLMPYDGGAAAEQKARDGDHANIVQQAVDDLHQDGAAAAHNLSSARGRVDKL